MRKSKNYLLDIVELKRCGNEEYANEYIAKGWLLLNQFVEERGAFGSYGIVYILGRPKSVVPDVPDTSYMSSVPEITDEEFARLEAEIHQKASQA